jgi:hypothetical protein
MLRWKRVTVERLSGPLAFEPIYTDGAPLSDVCVSSDGSVCCLRRRPGEAQVLSWPSEPHGRPMEWLGPRMPLVGIFGFDGQQVFGFSATSLVLLDPGRATTLWTTNAQISQPTASPDGSRLLWLEFGAKRRAYVSDVGRSLEPKRLKLTADCYGAVWLDCETIVALTVEEINGDEDAATVSLVSPLGKVREILVKGSRAISHLTGHPSHRILGIASSHFLGGTPRDAHRRQLTEDRGSEGHAGTWVVDPQSREAHCVSNEVPVGPLAFADDSAVFVVADREQSRLVVASRRRSVTATVPFRVTEFTVTMTNRAVLARRLLPTGAEILRFSIDPMLS